MGRGAAARPVEHHRHRPTEGALTAGRVASPVAVTIAGRSARDEGGRYREINHPLVVQHASLAVDTRCGCRSRAGIAADATNSP